MLIQVSDPYTRQRHDIPAPEFSVGDSVRVMDEAMGNPLAVVVRVEGPYLGIAASRVNRWLYYIRDSAGVIYPVCPGALRREGGGS